MEHYEIIINGEKHRVAGNLLNYEEIVETAFENERTDYTVTYSYKGENIGGILRTGDEVKVKNGMIINVTDTSKS
jgi:hypothetical protein